jgi:hypothetical protein
MPNGKNLTKRQLDVIEDLFAVEADEQQVFEKHKINRRVDDSFAASMPKFMPIGK